MFAVTFMNGVNTGLVPLDVLYIVKCDHYTNLGVSNVRRGDEIFFFYQAFKHHLLPLLEVFVLAF